MCGRSKKKPNPLRDPAGQQRIPLIGNTCFNRNTESIQRKIWDNLAEPFLRDTDTEIIELETLLETEFSFLQLRILIECIVTETELRDEDCPHLVLTEEIKDTLEGKDIVYGYNGNPYTRSTDVVDESINEYGCSHYTRYYVHVIQCMDLAISGDGQSICPGDSIMTLYYSKSKGEILNEEGRFVVPGLIDEKVTIANGVNDQVSNGKIELPTQKLKTPGHYTGKLIVEDANCGTKEFNLHFTVNYPSDIFLFKFNNVLAVYQNKGYDFTAYQWYRNGEPVEGATSSILYLGEGISFNEGDIVYVVLTDKSGMVLPSCAQIIEKLPPLDDNTNNAPAQKVLINNKFRIIKGDMTFDIYGQRVQWKVKSERWKVKGKSEKIF